MNKKIVALCLLLTVAATAYAQKFPVRFIRPGFPQTTGLVNMTALRTSIYAAAREAEISSSVRLAQEAARANLVKSVFRAYPLGETDERPYSGFIFKTTYQGQEEIFGAIAQHAMPTWNDGGTIGTTFTARVMNGEQAVDIPAEVVQVSATSMPDIALVKFRPEDEKWLSPLTLAEQEPTLNEPLQLIGFGMGELTLITDSPLLKTAPFNLRFPMAGTDWPGLCGSPVLNEAGEVVGTMTGAARKNASFVFHVDESGETSWVEKPADDYYTGYATRNLYLRTLVNAYHGDVEKATFPLMLGDKKIADLRSDEFVSLLVLKDEHGKTIFKKSVREKFPYSAIMEHLPAARYIELYIEKAWWSVAGLVEGGNILDARYVAYDLQEKQTVTEKKGRKTYPNW